MKYMLDTNICIYVIKKRPPEVIGRFLAQEASDICISVITYAELMHGVYKSQKPEQNRIALMLFLSSVQTVDLDFKAAEEYGRIKACLEQNGTPIGPMDTLIAAHAKSLGLTVVTNNEKEFRRVEGLKTENWVN